jgi:hypothetical protein
MPTFYDHKFPSPTKPERWIYVQTDDERAAATHLLAVLRKYWAPPKYFYHLRKGGHLSALQQHAHDNFFAVLDIEGFFGSVTKNKIARALKNIGFAWQDAVTVAHRSCVQEGVKRILPFGYVQSPMLASIVLNKSALGSALEAVKKQGLNVSVFMDDIILSHPDNGDLVWMR